MKISKPLQASPPAITSDQLPIKLGDAPKPISLSYDAVCRELQARQGLNPDALITILMEIRGASTSDIFGPYSRIHSSAKKISMGAMGNGLELSGSMQDAIRILHENADYFRAATAFTLG